MVYKPQPIERDALVANPADIVPLCLQEYTHQQQTMLSPLSQGAPCIPPGASSAQITDTEKAFQIPSIRRVTAPETEKHKD